MKIIFCSILLVLMATFTCAQQVIYPVDRVYMNDSTLYEGLVVEQAPAKYIKIFRTKEKDTLKLEMKDILKMTRVYPMPPDSSKMELKNNSPLKQVKNRFLQLELLGSGAAYSFNHDFRFIKTKKNAWGMRYGINFLNVPTLNYSGDLLRYSMLSIPVQVSYLAGRHNKFLELAAGATYIIKWKNGRLQSPEYEYTIKTLGRRIPNVFGTLTVGYRHHPNKGRIMWGVNATPLIGNSFIIPLVGFKIGYAII